MKILVTDGAGFIGSHIFDALVDDEKHDLTIQKCKSYLHMSTGVKKSVLRASYLCLRVKVTNVWWNWPEVC